MVLRGKEGKLDVFPFGARVLTDPNGFGTSFLTSFQVENTFTVTAMNIHSISCVL